MKAKLLPVIVLSVVSFAVAEDHVIEEKQQLYSIKGRPHVSVKNEDGDTRISAGSSGEVRVRYRKEVRNASSQEQAENAAKRVDVIMKQNGNQISVQVDYPKSYFQILPAPRVLVHFEIETPRASEITARASDGPLQVTGIEGRIHLTASDGDIKIRDCSGEMEISTSDGDLDAQEISGNAKVRVSDGNVVVDRSAGSIAIRSSDGNIRVSDFKGELDIETSDGDVELNGQFRSLHAATTDGNLAITAQQGYSPEADWSLKSSDGDIQLSLPKDFSVDLEISTADGEIITQTPVAIAGSVSSNKLKGKIAGGGRLLQIRTADGNVTIK